MLSVEIGLPQSDRVESAEQASAFALSGKERVLYVNDASVNPSGD